MFFYIALTRQNMKAIFPQKIISYTRFKIMIWCGFTEQYTVKKNNKKNII